MLNPEIVLVLVRLADLLAVGKGSDEFGSMSVVVEGANSIHDTVPAGWMFWLVLSDLVQSYVWTFARGVHSKVKSDLPLKKTDLVLGSEPLLFEECGPEDRTVYAVPVEYIISCVRG